MHTLSLPLAHWLTTDEAAEALQGLADQALSERHLLPLLTRLRQRYSAEQAAALLDQARLRQKGAEKFGAWAARMLFVEEALQQASGQAIARYRAARYAPFDQVADLGCGIGGDALALSERATNLLALDLDPVRALFAEHNLRVAGGSAQAEVVVADWTRSPFPPTMQAAFADPARRVAGRRVFSLHQMEPPLAAILAVQERLPHLGVKVMPGVPDEELPEGCEAEWISEAGTCKEGVLWFGALRTGHARTATVLVQGEEGTSQPHTLTSDDPAPAVPVTPPRTYLWEPEPCILRATLVAALAHRLDASQLDSEIAYLTSDTRLESPLARCWPILEHAPFNLKELNRRLHALDANVVAVKKRGSPIDPEAFRRRLKRNPHGQPVVVVVTRHRDEPWMVICGPSEGAG